MDQESTAGFRDMKTSMTRSSLTGMVQSVINAALVFVTIPSFIRILGAESYGVFSLVAIIGNVNTFANFGLNSSLVRFLAKQGKSDESDYDIIVTFIILLAILVPLTVGALVFQQDILVRILGVNAEMMNDAQWLFVSMLLGNALVLLGQTFTAILDSQQKIYLTNMFQMIYNFIYWSLILVALWLNYALKGVAIATCAASVIWFCMVALSSLISWKGISFRGLQKNGARVARKQLSYGLKIYTAGVVGFFHEPLTKILVSRLIGIPEVGLFDIGLRVRNQVVGLVTKLLSPLYPAISQMSDPDKVRTLVHDVEQKTFLVVLPISIIVVLLAKTAANMVFHSHIDAISITVASFVVVYLVCSTTVLPIYLFLMAKGYPSRNILLQSMNSIVNAVVLIIALPLLHYYAAVAANMVAIFSTFLMLLVFQKKYLNSLIFDSTRQVAKLLFATILAFGIGYCSISLATGDWWKLISAPIVVLCVTIISYRQLEIVTFRDVRRYLGERTPVSIFVTRVLCKTTS